MRRLASCAAFPFILVTALVAACNVDPVWVHVGRESIRRSEVLAAVGQAGPAIAQRLRNDPVPVLRDLFGPRIFLGEATRLGLTVNDPLKAQERVMLQWRQQLETTLQPSDIGDAELFAIYQKSPRYLHYPERVYLSLFVFSRAADAKRFASSAQSVTSVESFKKRFDAMGFDPQQVDAGDVFAMRAGENGLPSALVEASFSSPLGRVSGPISTPCSRFQVDCHYVVFPRSLHQETNTFAQRRDELLREAYERALGAQLQNKKRALFEQVVQIEQAAISQLSTTSFAHASR